MARGKRGGSPVACMNRLCFIRLASVGAVCLLFVSVCQPLSRQFLFLPLFQLL